MSTTNLSALSVSGALSVGGSFAAGGVPAGITLSPAAGGSNVCEVTVTVVDGAGAAIAKVFTLDLWLSDAASGAGLTATSASGNVEAKTSSGVVLQAVTAKKHLRVQTLATGVFVLSITDTAKTAFKVCVSNPATGLPHIVTLATGNYG